MANITKAELVDQVAAQAGTDKTTAASVLKAFEETILAHVTKGDGLKGFFWPRRPYDDDAHAAAVATAIRDRLA